MTGVNIDRRRTRSLNIISSTLRAGSADNLDDDEKSVSICAEERIAEDMKDMAECGARRGPRCCSGLGV